MDDGKYLIKIVAVVTKNKTVQFEIVVNKGERKLPIVMRPYKAELEDKLVETYIKGIKGNDISVEIKDGVVTKIV